MYKFLKWVIIIWTALFLFSIISSCFTTLSDRSVSVDSIGVGSIIGTALGFGIVFVIWFVPTAIMGVIALLIKPKQKIPESPPRHYAVIVADIFTGCRNIARFVGIKQPSTSNWIASFRHHTIWLNYWGVIRCFV